VFIGRILFVEGALSRSDKATKIRNELTTRRTAIEPILRERIERARVEGDESVEGVPQKVARYISTVVQGMAVPLQAEARAKSCTKSSMSSLAGCFAVAKLERARANEAVRRR
jgi:hypothetical protein